MSVNRRCLLFTIILKSVSSSVDLQQPFLSSSDLQFSLSLFFFYSRSLVYPITPESATRKMETFASAWTRPRAEWISPLSYICENPTLPRITTVACPIVVISSSKEIFQPYIFDPRRIREINFYPRISKWSIIVIWKRELVTLLLPGISRGETASRREYKVKREYESGVKINDYSDNRDIYTYPRYIERHVALITYAMFSSLKSRMESSIAINDAGAVRL